MRLGCVFENRVFLQREDRLIKCLRGSALSSPPVSRPTAKGKTSRPPERDYSHRSLLDKLGIKSGQAIAVLDVEDSSFFDELASRVSDFPRDSVTDGLDIVLLGAGGVNDLRRLKSLAEKIRKNGAIWVVYPKGRTHIREVEVIAAGKAAGLVDNKVCRFSETHTALRFVIPLAKR